ncbi:hypothetical protein [Mesorhizobium sp. WSM4904]|uniref:hypothetical protein n=1 Tax=Mesorhizobium sp. WSM4904 TaxID=3038545 RepID=UPI002418A8C9|nr:hypothetical protein [Mesorhizobium sp. WSM4904]WFP61326.1 hypothetical protein QAZ47_22930 [Mesorhizobium sp. WSM4904]
MVELLSRLGEKSFGLSFLFGTLVIALYAGKRLGELITPPKGAEYDFTSMLTLPLLVGRDTYNRAYIFYVFLLLYFYFVLCIFQPLVDIIGGKTTIKFQGASWPLFAALLVVGVLPATPVVAQIEHSLRRFAHAIANIPDEFYNRVTALSAQEIETVVVGAPDYESDVETFWTLIALLSILGIEYDDAVRGSRRCVSLRLFGEWTLERPDIWSQAEYQRYNDVVAMLKPQYLSLRAKTEDLVFETESNPFVKSVLASNPTVLLGGRIDPGSAQALRIEAEKLLTQGKKKGVIPNQIPLLEDLKFARQEWSEHIKACEIDAKRLIALFSIVVRNDRRTMRELVRPENAKNPKINGPGVLDKRYADPGLRFFAQLLRSNNIAAEPWFNSILLATLVGSGFAYLFCILYRLATDNDVIRKYVLPVENLKKLKPQTLDSLISNSIASSASDVGFLALAFLLSASIALFMRSSRIRNEEWLPFYDLPTIPVSSYFGLFLISWIMALPALMLQWIVFYARSQELPDRDNLIHVMQINVGIAFALASASVCLCIVTDIVSTQAAQNVHRGIKQNRRYFNQICLLACILPAGLHALILLTDQGYVRQPAYMVGQMLIFAFLIYAAMRFFVTTLEHRLRRVMPLPVQPALDKGQGFGV